MSGISTRRVLTPKAGLAPKAAAGGELPKADAGAPNGDCACQKNDVNYGHTCYKRVRVTMKGASKIPAHSTLLTWPPNIPVLVVTPNGELACVC